MAAEHFVGRSADVARLAAVLTGRESTDGKLTVLSVEGPGGIGKTCLFDHVLGATDLADRRYLTLRVDGNGPDAQCPVRAVARMAAGADAGPIRGRPPGYYFPAVDRVAKAADAIRAAADAEFRDQHPDHSDGRDALGRFLDLVFAA